MGSQGSNRIIKASNSQVYLCKLQSRRKESCNTIASLPEAWSRGWFSENGKKKEKVQAATNFPTRKKKRQPRKHLKLRNLQQKKRKRLPSPQLKRLQRKLPKKRRNQKPWLKNLRLRKLQSQQQRRQLSQQRRLQRITLTNMILFVCCR